MPFYPDERFDFSKLTNFKKYIDDFEKKVGNSNNKTAVLAFLKASYAFLEYMKDNEPDEKGIGLLSKIDSLNEGLPKLKELSVILSIPLHAIKDDIERNNTAKIVRSATGISFQYRSLTKA